MVNQRHPLQGRKTTEYFDIDTISVVSRRIQASCPDLKVIVVLREPIARAFSALHHTVLSGLERMPVSADALLFEDRARPVGRRFGFIDRGFYATQLEILFDHVDPKNVLVLNFERDICSAPETGLSKVFQFLGVQNERVSVEARSRNDRRMSQLGIRMMYSCRGIPGARNVIWRADRYIPLKHWKPTFTDETRLRLSELYAPQTARLFELLNDRYDHWLSEAANVYA